MSSTQGNWWQYNDKSGLVAEWLSRHTLTLYIAFKFEGTLRRDFFSGFVLRYNDCLLWITAGHVIDLIRDILTDPRISIERVRWADGVNMTMADALPADPLDIAQNSFSLRHEGKDVGAVIISGINALNIITNGRTIIMTDKVWKHIEEVEPEGYFLLGYPDEWNSEETPQITEGQIIRADFAGFAWLPVQKIQIEDIAIEAEDDKNFWSNRSAFYGKLVPFLNEPDAIPSDIGGMSGGPLFGITTTNDGQLRYDLVGVQSAWLRARRIIRVEPIKQILLFEDRK